MSQFTSGEAEWKFTLAKLFKPLNLKKKKKKKKNGQAQFPWKNLSIIGFEIRYMLCASLKMFLNIVWSELQPKNLIIMAVGTKTNKFVSFRITGRYVQVFSNLVEK